MKCNYYLNNQCASCDLLSLDYACSVRNKEQVLARFFPEYINKIKPSVVMKHGAEGSRNKAKLAVALIRGQIEFGFYTHSMEFRELENCPLHAPVINNILNLLKGCLTRHKIVPYDLSSKTGELKYVLITHSETTNEVLLRFVLRSTESISRLKKLAAESRLSNPLIKVVTANIQDKHQAILEGDEEIVLTEEDGICHRFDEYFLLQGPRSFFQTNSTMALALYRQFQQELSALPINTLLDLYCGVGAFSFFASKHCSHVVGVEISEAAIIYANKAREKNKSVNTEFLAMEAEAYLTQQKTSCFDAILVNPPRRGLNDTITSHLLRLKSDYLFYSSCNAETLHRDLLSLQPQYEIQSLQIFDMFPFTSHFEILAVLIYTVFDS